MTITKMATSECSSKATTALLTLLAVTLVVLLAAVTTIQFKWKEQLRRQYEDSRQELLRLQTTCFDDADPDVALAVMQDAVRKSLERMDAQGSPDRRKRQVSSSLEQMLTDMMLAKEKELMANCINSSKLCLPGKKGDPGTKGDGGTPGQPGTTGDKGDQGPKGMSGPTGLNGTKGDTGPTGVPGLNGTRGPKGAHGLKGDDGVMGQRGPVGKQGPAGLHGDKGAKGSRGPVGVQGTNGTLGQKGDKGDTGLNGTKGDIGPQGPDGAPGVPPDSCACVIKPKIDVFQPNASSVSYPLGSHVKLTCNATTTPKATITWTGPLGGCDPATSSGDGVLDIASLQPIQLGTYTCTVTNPYGTTSKTVTITSNVTNALDCDFENHTRPLCLWSNSKSDRMDWFSIAGQTPSSNTGPSVDHTRGNTKGHYVYLETSSGNTGHAAELVSPEMGPSSGMCLSFWYNMYGSQMGSLNVETQTCNSSSPNSIRLHLTGNQGQAWHMAQIQIPSIPGDHRVVIKGSKGSGIYSDMAVDDIKYYPGRCKTALTRSGSEHQNIGVAPNAPLDLNCGISGTPPASYHWEKLNGCPITAMDEHLTVTKHADSGTAGTYICTATSAGKTLKTTFNVTYTGPTETTCTFEHGQCGWTQPSTDDFDWLLNHGPSPSRDTGPLADHTFKNDSGQYMFIESSSPRTLGDSAILRSYMMPGKQAACLSLAYSMFGGETGNLRILIEDACTKRTSLLFNESGDKGQAWLERSLSIAPPAHDYYVQVKAEVGSSYHGDIAVDDLVLKTGSCPASG